ncbi:MAG: dienelactone hydrolase family protein [Desulfobacteraceae bacterium]|nr:dienelactone hydrolase family protein [Desulfobacteraceae bacterium]
MRTKLFYMLAALLLLTVVVPAQAAVVTETVTYRHEGQTLEGFMAWDDAIAGKRPGVLVVHEWWGLNDYVRDRARQLAELGYVAFALDMYGVGKVTEHPSQAGEWMKMITENLDFWRHRALAGLAVLKGAERVDPDRITAIGYCFGGSTVQQLAYGGANIRGVVSFHGSPLLPGPGEVERVRAKILICHGAADPFTKPEQLQKYLTEMGTSGLDWQFIAYGGARHGFTNPGADAKGMEALAYNRSADMRSWAHMRLFFEEIF